MNQVLHIFRKDARRHWLEIIVSLLLLLGFAWKMPILWSDEPPFGEPRVARWLLALLGISLCFSWWFLIVRVIQGESLVGDRQFWLTRPYQRPWLMASKALFIIAFVNVPVFIFDVALLARAGFSPWHHLPGLLRGQLFLTAFLVLPVATISVITESPVQFLLIFFGVVAYISGLTWLVALIPSSSAGGDIPSAAVLTLAAATCLALLVLQYFRRDTAVSRWTLLGSLCAIAIGLTAAPYGRLVEHAYPDLPLGSLVPAGVIIEKTSGGSPDNSRPRGKTVTLYVPIDTSGLVQGSLVEVDAARLTIYAPGGLAWNSGWVSSGRTLWPAPTRFTQAFDVSSKFYSAVAGSAADMRIGLAVTEFREGKPRQIKVVAGSFMITDAGICAAAAQTSYWATATLQCKSALNEPAFAAHLDPKSTTCTLPDRAWPSLQLPRNDGNPTADFEGGAGLFPVQPFEINFGAAISPSGDKAVSIVCPGTSFSIATPARFSRYRIAMEIQAVHLADFRASDF
ncbi:MAG: hypothetical protein WB680_06410 [Candidatus Acidiferrales bacterium]